jgi:hypothetical protein
MAEETRTATEPSRSTIDKLVDQLTSHKREIYAYLDQALNLDSKNQSDESIILYRKCLNMTQKTFEFVRKQFVSFQKVPEVIKIQSDLNKIYEQTSERLQFLEESLSNVAKETSEFVDIADEVLNYTDPSDQITYSNDANATELLKIDHSVKLFYISSDGSVSTPSHAASLSIYSFK